MKSRIKGLTLLVLLNLSCLLASKFVTVVILSLEVLSPAAAAEEGPAASLCWEEAWMAWKKSYLVKGTEI